MPKYRLLTGEELESLKKEFIDFLVLTGITGPDWSKLKNNDQAAANGILESFSDVVFEQILRKAMFVEFRDSKNLMCIQCLKEKMILVGAKAQGNYDFQKSGIENLEDGLIKVYTTEKPYGQIREREIFGMLNQGYQITNGELFKKLCLVL